MENFGRFCGAVWSHWEARFGTTFAVILAVIQYSYLAVGDPTHIPAWVKSFPPYLWLAIGGVLFFWSCYVAWNEKHLECADEKLRCGELQRQLEDRKPHFIFVISEASWRYEEADDKTLFFLMATIINQGQDSIAVGWSANFSIGTVSEEMVPLWLINPYVLQVGKTMTTLTNADLLPAKTRNTPVMRGSLAEGRLLFTLDGNRLLVTNPRNFTIVVTFLDFMHNEYSCEFKPDLAQVTDLRYPHTENVARINQPASTSSLQKPDLPPASS